MGNIGGGFGISGKGKAQGSDPWAFFFVRGELQVARRLSGDHQVVVLFAFGLVGGVGAG